MRKHRQTKTGFTIMEVMVGMTVFAIGMLGSLGLLSWITRADAFTTQMVTAGNVGQTHLEVIRGLGFDGATSGTGTDGVYNVAWTVSSPTGALRTVDVTVDWHTRDGVYKTQSYSTLVMNEDPVPALPTFAIPGATAGGIPTIPPGGGEGGEGDANGGTTTP